MPRVVVMFTGGTISTAFDPVAGGNVPVLDGAAIIERTPGLADVADVVAVDLGRTPASHFTFPMLLDIAATVRASLADPTVDGAVVVQGTDTIEETSFCWDLVLEGSEAGRRDRRDASLRCAGLRRAREPARRGPGRGRSGDARHRRRRLSGWDHRTGR